MVWSFRLEGLYRLTCVFLLIFDLVHLAFWLEFVDRDAEDQNEADQLHGADVVAVVENAQTHSEDLSGRNYQWNYVLLEDLLEVVHEELAGCWKDTNEQEID